MGDVPPSSYKRLPCVCEPLASSYERLICVCKPFPRRYERLPRVRGGVCARARSRRPLRVGRSQAFVRDSQAFVRDSQAFVSRSHVFVRGSQAFVSLLQMFVNLSEAFYERLPRVYSGSDVVGSRSHGRMSGFRGFMNRSYVWYERFRCCCEPFPCVCKAVHTPAKSRTAAPRGRLFYLQKDVSRCLLLCRDFSQ
jgi:hypothetical protein